MPKQSFTSNKLKAILLKIVVLISSGLFSVVQNRGSHSPCLILRSTSSSAGSLHERIAQKKSSARRDGNALAFLIRTSVPGLIIAARH